MNRSANINRKISEANELCPNYSDGIIYVCLTHTHFVHAQKLALDGSRTYMNEGKIKFQWKDEYVEGWPIVYKN